MDSNWWIAIVWPTTMIGSHVAFRMFDMYFYGLERGKINTKFGYNQYHFKYYH
jgi:hypothetical protein